MKILFLVLLAMMLFADDPKPQIKPDRSYAIAARNMVECSTSGPDKLDQLDPKLEKLQASTSELKEAVRLMNVGVNVLFLMLCFVIGGVATLLFK